MRPRQAEGAPKDGARAPPTRGPSHQLSRPRGAQAEEIIVRVEGQVKRFDSLKKEQAEK